MKKTLKVHFSANMIDESIIKFLNQQFEIELIELTQNEIRNPNQKIVEKIKSIDLMLFTGGEDVNPDHYGEEKGMFTNINEKRDKLEFNLLYSPFIPSSIIKKIPKLGICRG